MKYINKFQKFMKGRYGVDELTRFIIKIYFILVIINLFITNKVLYLLELILLFIMFYRFLSKKIYKRSNENQLFLKTKNNLLKPFKNIERNKKDKEHIYKKCHKCKTTLKLPLPSKRGIKKVKCPKCGKRIKFLTLKQERIEIIKNGKKIKK